MGGAFFSNFDPFPAAVNIISIAVIIVLVYVYLNERSKYSNLYAIHSGSRWLYLKDFYLDKVLPLRPAAEYPRFVSGITTVFVKFCPTRPGMIAAETTCRSQSKMQAGTISKGPFEKAHLIPHCRTCHVSFKPLFKPMLRSISSSRYSDDVLLDLMFCGFRRNSDDNRVRNSGILHNLFNLVGVDHQFQGMDLKTLIAFIPLTIDGQPVTIRAILEWEGEEVSALILPHTAEVGIEYFGFTHEAGEYVDDICCNDPMVQNAIDVFNEYLLMIVPYLSNYDVYTSGVGENKLLLCQVFREFCRNRSPRIPCLNQPLSQNRFLKVQTFPARQINFPDQGQSRARRASSVDSVDLKFSVPHPFFLLLRAINAWLDLLHVGSKWLEWSSYFQICMAKDRRFRGRKDMHKARLVLLPSCCDISMYEPDCVICKSHVVIGSPEAFSGLSEYLLRVAKMFVHTQATLTEGQAHGLLELRANPLYCRQLAMEKRRTSSLSAAETLRLECMEPLPAVG